MPAPEIVMDISDINSNLSDGDADLDTGEDIEEDVDEEREPHAFQMNSPNKPVRKAFSNEQVTCLCDHYKRGKIGVGRKYSALIEAASEEAGLMIKQVKVSHNI